MGSTPSAKTIVAIDNRPDDDEDCKNDTAGFRWKVLDQVVDHSVGVGFGEMVRSSRCRVVVRAVDVRARVLVFWISVRIPIDAWQPARSKKKTVA